MHIKLGTRKSKLALWQAHHVEKLLLNNGHTVEIVKMVSEGDKVLDTPLPLMGGKGVFTKVLDDALLNKEIDIAVHSLKDIPTVSDKNLEITAILKRENPTDALVCRNDLSFLNKKDAVIATSSTRRKAQWLNKYPTHQIVDIRGNVPTRIKKLKESNWDATLLACAGLIRLDLENEISKQMDWMVGAPGQGAVAIMSLKENNKLKSVISEISDPDTWLCTNIERQFLNTLNGGCSSPVGAHTYIEDNKVFFNGVVLNENGTKKININISEIKENALNLGVEAAKIAIDKGAKKLIDQNDKP